MSINKWIGSGNLTRDPELRQTQAGTNILTFGIAVNDRVRNGKTGEWEDYANFIDCVLFGNRAETMSRILSKGMKVTVEGKLHWSSWERDGSRRSKIEVTVDNIDLPPRNARNEQPQQQTHQFAQQYGTYQGGNQQVTYQQPDVYDGDIPFDGVYRA